MKHLLLAFALFLVTCPLQASQPNVLFIAIDDLRADLNCYGNSQIHSPNIDELAQVGTLFNHAYCQQAVCNPSRSSMLTGLRLDTLHLWDLPTHFRQRIAEVVTLPQLFKQNGYHTQCVGKIFHNWRQDDYKGDAVSWSAPEELHYNSHGNDKAVVKGKLPPNISDVPKCVIRDVPDEAYFDGRVARRAIEVLNDLKNKPFYLAVGFWKPHAHFSAPKKYWDLYDPTDIKLPINRKHPVNVPEIALHNGQEILRSYKEAPNGYPTHHQAREMRRGYYANISYMDAQVGKVLDELDRLKLRDNTIIVLWSDHGFHLGEKQHWAKRTLWEESTRVPLLFAGPGIKPGTACAEPARLLDIYPTLVEMCRLPKNTPLEGISLVPQLNDPATPRDRPAITSSYFGNHSIRSRDWRLIVYEDGVEELYDHRNDPDEFRNLANAPSHKATRDQLARWLPNKAAPEFRTRSERSRGQSK